MWAVIPIKKIQDAKHRLHSVLSPSERRDLSLNMFEDVLSTLKSVPELERVVVATVCPTASRIAGKYGVYVFSTNLDKSLSAAVSKAASAIEANGVSGMLMLPSDIPLVTAEEIQTVLELHARAPSMTIVPSRDEKGSNCIALSPPTAAPLKFGSNSYFPHLDTARNLGLVLNNPKLPGIGLDIDKPEDLVELCRQPLKTKTQKYLQKKRIRQRLKIS
tara:strand:+ start:626 stop:1279 length:654 start_codon:yes stop_codon:yes gene_type:complete